MTSDRLAYDLTAAAAAVGLSRRAIEQAITAGDLPAKAGGPKGGKRLILAADLAAWLDRLPDHTPERTR